MGLKRIFLMFAVVGLSPICSVAGEPSGSEIISHCEYKNPGKDQRSRLTIVLIDKDGSERKNVYRRLWKNYYGEDNLIDKMVLFTEFPPDAKGVGFMRWGYTAASKKLADQWLYLPHLRKVRRVSVRDPGDSFLGSDLAYGDMEDRAIDADDHALVRVEEMGGKEYYVVESTAKEEQPLYTKKISWFVKSDNGWDACARAKTDYYDRQGSLLKTQGLTWQQVGDAWAWDKVIVENVQTGHKSIFSVTNVEVGVGIKDKQITERAMKKGGS